MEDTILVKDLLWILAAIMTIAGFIGFVSSPYNKLKNKISEQEQSIKELSSEIKTQQQLLNSSLKVQLLLMQHIIYGNHTDALKDELTKLQATIINVNK